MFAMMQRMFARFLIEARGTTAIMFALALPAIMALIGIAIDVASMEGLRARLQSISDAAALAAARELSLPNAKTSQIKSVVAENISARAGANNLFLTNTVDVDYQKQQVRVGLAQDWTPFFAHFLNSSVTPVRVNSTARLLTAQTKTCVLALDTAASKAIHADKNAVVTASECAIYSNSTDSQSIRLDMNSTIKASYICAAGGIKTFKAGSAQPEPISDCPAIPDPLALRAPPAFGACDWTNRIIDTGKVTLSPGVYCGGLTITGNAEISFDKGIYVMKDGPLKLDNQAIVHGNDVGFYFFGTNAVFNCAGEASVELSGRTDGSMAGLLFFEDRDTLLNQKHTISCNNASELTGTIYLPRGTIRVDPNASVADKSAYTAIIAQRIELDEGPELFLNADYNATDVPVPEGLKSAGTVILTQ